MCGSEGNRRLLAALRASGSRFHAGILAAMIIVLRLRRVEHGHTFGFASLTTFGLVLKLLVVEKKLFPGGKNEACTTVDTGQYLILKFH